MAIDNKEAIKFSNEIVRKNSATLGNLHCELVSILSVWTDYMNQLIPDDASELIVDGRTTLYTPNGKEVNNQMAFMLDIKGVFEDANHEAAVAFMKKARVSPLKAGE
jgi:hypothetical protein